LVREFAAVLRRHGVSIPMWRTMATLFTEPGQTVSALAAACLLQQPTMTKLLDRMEREGLVVRAQDAQDRRVVRITLTPEGQAKAADLAATAERH
jgi:DNA-binding MarR family transcriptional regulator